MRPLGVTRIHRPSRYRPWLAFVVVGLVVAAAATVAFVPRSGAIDPRSVPPRSVRTGCPAPTLGGTLPAEVYLPAGYDPGGARLPVIYFLHGLPADRSSYLRYGFVAAALRTAHLDAIVVVPQAARADGDDREYLNWSPTENWPLAISHTLTECIDQRFHTIANRRGRALIGLSAGGYGAANIGLRNLALFGAVESWSGYFEATNPSGTHILRLATAGAQTAATVPTGSSLLAEEHRWPALIAFYVGRADSRFLTMNETFDAALRRSGIPHRFQIYPGGHSAALWRAEAPSWLTLALDRLAQERAAVRAARG
jgi:putative tributyrin esterase